MDIPGLCRECDDTTGRCASKRMQGLGPCCDECTHTTNGAALGGDQ